MCKTPLDLIPPADDLRWTVTVFVLAFVRNDRRRAAILDDLRFDEAEEIKTLEKAVETSLKQVNEKYESKLSTRIIQWFK